MLFARCLARDLARASPGEVFEVAVGVGEPYTVRFYKSRPGQSLFDDDLEAFQEEAILVLTVGGRRLRLVQ